MNVRRSLFGLGAGWALALSVSLAVPATASAEVFSVGYSGFGCSDTIADASPVTIAAPCNHTDTFEDASGDFFSQIVYESFFRARADYTSLGAYAEAFNAELGPDHVLRTPLFTGASAGLSGSLIVLGGFGAGTLRTAFNVDGSSSVTHVGFPLTASAALFVTYGSTSSSLEGPGTLLMDVPFVFGVPITFAWSFGAGVGPIHNDVGVRIGGVSDFYSSATLAPFAIFDSGMTPVVDGSVVTGDGVALPTVRSVPVPEPRLLLLMGPAVAAACARRFRAARRERARVQFISRLLRPRGPWS